MSNEWREYFPKWLEPRPEQKIILDEIVAGFANGFTDIFVEAATGIGKSAIAVTKARMLSAIAITEARMQKGKSYIMTTDISLEDQYVIDFGSFLNQLHSSVNYEECPSCSNCSIGNTGQPKKCLQVLENKVLDTIMSSHQIPCDYQRARWIFE